MPILPFSRERRPPLAPSSSEELAAAAFHAAYAELYPPGLIFARKAVGTMWADDLVHGAFLRMWAFYYKEAIPVNDAEDLFFRILRRQITDWLAKEENTEARHNDHVLELKPRLTNATDTARVADESLLRARVSYLVAALPPQMRRAFELRDAGADYESIAAQIDASQGTARWNVAQARQRIARQLAKDGYDVPAIGARSKGEADR